MTGTSTPDPGFVVDEARLTSFLAKHLERNGDELTVTRVSAGHSNEMFAIATATQRWMLKRPPLAVVDARANDISREFRVLRALDQTSIPHARAVLFCDDQSIIGAPFMVSEWAEGESGQVPTKPWLEGDDNHRRGLAFELVDILARIGTLDWQGIGLANFGRPDQFLERQVPRWLSQFESYRVRDIPGMDVVVRWLTENRPTRTADGLLHGDYSAANVMFDHDTGRISAVIDWEISTIGDPMLDLGWFLCTWESADDDHRGRTPGLRVSELPGMPTRTELAHRYLSATGREFADVAYFQVLALFKYSCILEGSYVKSLRGNSSDPVHALWGERVLAFMERAVAVIEGRWS